MYTLQDLRVALEKARKTISRQRGQLAQMSNALMEERAENAKLHNDLFKMQLELEREVR